MSFILRFRTSFTFLVAGTLLLFCKPVAVGQSRPSAEEVTIEKKLIEGKKYTLLGDWEKAEAIFKAILQEDVQNSAACYELSRTLAASGKTSEALTFIRKAIRIEPDNEWYQLMEADIHEKNGDLFSAMDIYDRLILLRPNKPDYYEMQINFCKKTGEQERLLAVLDKYEELVGINESLTRIRFETLDGLGRTAEAMNAIEKLVQVYPNQKEYKYLAASYAKKTGEEDKALIYYKQILELDPEDSRAKLALAGSGKKEGDKAGYLKSILPIITNPEIGIDVKLQELIPYVVQWSETRDTTLGNALLELVRQLVLAHPKDAKGYAIQGDVLSIRGENLAAIQSYKMSTGINGSVYVVWEQLISLLIKSRSYDELIVQSGQAIDNFPNQGYLYYANGFGAYKKKQYDEALEMLNEALIMTGRNAGQKISVYNILGLVYDELGDIDKSSFAFESALNIDPKNAETLAHYGLMLSRRISQSEKVLEMTQRVLSQGSQPALIHEILAEVFYNQKKYSEAYVSIQEVLKTDPHAVVYNMAGDILLKLGKTDDAVAMWKNALEAGSDDTEIKKKIADHKAQ